VLAVFAPAAPALGETVVAAGLFLAWVVAFGLLWVYRSTLGAIALGLADRIEDVGIPTGIRRIHPFGPLADAHPMGRRRDRRRARVGRQEHAARRTILFQLVTRQLRAIGDRSAGSPMTCRTRSTARHGHDSARGRARERAGAACARQGARTLALATAATIAHELPNLRHRGRATANGSRAGSAGASRA
jgi:hypothetical protein